jgi:hypothetical protein
LIIDFKGCRYTFHLDIKLYLWLSKNQGKSRNVRN